MSNRVIPFQHRTCTDAFAIQDGSTSLYFIWCYENEKFATDMADILSIKSADDQQANWRARLDQLVLSKRTSR